jgi:hypothetical protein
MSLLGWSCATVEFILLIEFHTTLSAEVKIDVRTRSVLQQFMLISSINSIPVLSIRVWFIMERSNMPNAISSILEDRLIKAEAKVSAAEARLVRAQDSTENGASPADIQAADVRIAETRVDLARAELAVAEAKVALARADVAATGDPTDGISARRALESAQTLVDIQLRALSHAHEDAQAARAALRRTQGAADRPAISAGVSDRRRGSEHAFAPVPKRPAYARRVYEPAERAGSSSPDESGRAHWPGWAAGAAAAGQWPARDSPGINGGGGGGVGDGGGGFADGCDGPAWAADYWGPERAVAEWTSVDRGGVNGVRGAAALRGRVAVAGVGFGFACWGEIWFCMLRRWASGGALGKRHRANFWGGVCMCV